QTKTAVALILILGLSVPVFGQSIGRHEVARTPYDPYMTAFRRVVSRMPGQGSLSLATVEKLAEKAHDIRYDHLEDYLARSPEEVESSGRGDCKDKALWLYSKLLAVGARDLQMVIGKKD